MKLIASSMSGLLIYLMPAKWAAAATAVERKRKERVSYQIKAGQRAILSSME